MKGLDISSYQNGINFDAIKNAGINFLILRAGFTGWGTGVNYNKDKSFEHFYNQSKSHNIPVGAYWYSCANTKEKGIAEAKYMYENCLKGNQFEFPIYIDVEDTHHQVGNKRGVTDAIIGFCEYLENLGYYVGIYASDISGFKDKMYLNELNAYDKWVAHYGNKPKYVTSAIKGFCETLEKLGMVPTHGELKDLIKHNNDYLGVLDDSFTLYLCNGYQEKRLVLQSYRMFG